MADRIFLIILLFSSLPLVIGVPDGFEMVSGIIQAFFLPGFAVLSFMRSRDRHWFDKIVLSALLSPVILTVTTLILAETGIPWERSLRISLFAACFIIGVAMATGRFREADSKLSIPWNVPVICVAFAGLIAACFTINPDLLKRSDAWYHASVTSEILARGIPPMEPLLADFPIKYMWYYHLFIASVVRLSHLQLFTALGLFNVMAAFSFPYLLARYASFFTKNAKKTAIIVLLGLAGLESVSWFLWPVELARSLTGDVRGMAEIARTFGKIEFNSSNVISSLNPYGTWMVNLPDKFLTITVFSYSLNLFLLGVYSALASWRDGKAGARDAVLLLVAVFGTVIFHVVTGVTMAVTIIGAVVLAALFKRIKGRAGIPPGMSLVVPLAVISGFALSIPLLAKLNMGAGGGTGNFPADYLHLGLKNLLTLSLPLLILISPLRGAMRRYFPSHMGAEYLMITGMAICLLILNIFADLPSVNESKFIFPLFLVAGAPIYAEIADRIVKSAGAKKRGLIILVLLLFLPAPLLTFRGFIMDRPSDQVVLKRVITPPAEMAAFDWLRSNSPLDAVVIENNNYHLAPVLACRHGFHSDSGIINVLGYDKQKMDLMAGIKDRVFSDLPVPGDMIEYLRRMNREIFILLLEEDLRAKPSLSAKFESDTDRFKLVFSNEKARLFKVL